MSFDLQLVQAGWAFRPLTPDIDGQIAADFDKDGDVDMEDFGVFQRCYSGLDKPADPNCTD